jgi:hypothetical protein
MENSTTYVTRKSKQTTGKSPRLICHNLDGTLLKDEKPGYPVERVFLFHWWLKGRENLSKQREKRGVSG